MSACDSVAAKPGICVAVRPSPMTFSASGRRRRSRLSGSSAGPMPPVRCVPWQEAQCCWNSAAASTVAVVVGAGADWAWARSTPIQSRPALRASWPALASQRRRRSRILGLRMDLDGAAAVAERRHGHALRIAARDQADLVVAQVAARVFRPGVARELLGAHARVAAADLEIVARRAAATHRAWLGLEARHQWL